jgi:hypothetical protein
MIKLKKNKRKSWKYESKYPSVRKRIKRQTQKAERTMAKQKIKEETDPTDSNSDWFMEFIEGASKLPIVVECEQYKKLDIFEEHCLHNCCPRCNGLGVREDGSPCIHFLSCNCPKCSPRC